MANFKFHPEIEKELEILSMLPWEINEAGHIRCDGVCPMAAITKSRGIGCLDLDFSTAASILPGVEWRDAANVADASDYKFWLGRARLKKLLGIRDG